METKWSWIQPLQSNLASSEISDGKLITIKKKERELVRLLDGDYEVMGSIPTFHTGI